jgi:hypothetical protein
MTDEERLRHALERCRAWNIRNRNWSQEMEELVKAALAEPAQGTEKVNGTTTALQKDSGHR